MILLLSCPLKLYEDDDEGEQREGLDEHQAENHRGTDGVCGAWIARHTFARCGCDPPLTETAAERCDTHAEGCGDAEQTTSGVITAGGCVGALRERCGSDEHHRRERR